MWVLRELGLANRFAAVVPRQLEHESERDEGSDLRQCGHGYRPFSPLGSSSRRASRSNGGPGCHGGGEYERIGGGKASSAGRRDEPASGYVGRLSTSDHDEPSSRADMSGVVRTWPFHGAGSMSCLSGLLEPHGAIGRLTPGCTGKKPPPSESFDPAKLRALLEPSLGESVGRGDDSAEYRPGSISRCPADHAAGIVRYSSDDEIEYARGLPYGAVWRGTGPSGT